MKEESMEKARQFIREQTEQARSEHEEISQEEIKNGQRILDEVCRSIKKLFPELLILLRILKPVPVGLPIHISTDFKHLFFNPKEVIRLHQKEDEEELQFQVLHVLLHGLFGDNEKAMREGEDKCLWLACDQKVNDICSQLGMGGSDNDRKFNTFYMKEYQPYSSSFGNYYRIRNSKSLRNKARVMQNKIASDEHFLWYPAYGEMLSHESLSGEEGGDMENGKDTEKQWAAARKIILGDGMEKGLPEEILSAFDAETSERIVNSITKKQKDYGRGSGNQLHPAKEADGEPVDYRTRFMEFLQVTEVTKEIPDSIDPMMYCFGLDFYENALLIEPRENEESVSLSTICIAVDTSGSCNGMVASKFLRETRAMIASAGEYLENCEIVLLQCDETIQCEEHTSLREFMETQTARGMFRGYGGTSFVPVFERVGQLKEEGKKVDLLIYLTDGSGEYPAFVPDYPVLFVMEKEQAEWFKESREEAAYIEAVVMEDRND